jgi:hypothetical protein
VRPRLILALCLGAACTSSSQSTMPEGRDLSSSLFPDMPAPSDLAGARDASLAGDADCPSVTPHTQLYLDNACVGGAPYCLGPQPGS